MEHEDFVRFYLEEESRGSNVYFAVADQPAKKGFTVYYHLLPGHVAYKRLSFGEVGRWIGAAACAFVIAAFLLVYEQGLFASPTPMLVATANAYDHMNAAEDAFWGLHFSEAVSHMNEASLTLENTKRSGALSRTVLSLLSSLPFVGSPQESDVPKLEQALSDAVQAAVDAADPLSQLPRASLWASEQESDQAIMPIGALFAEALTRLENAKSKIASAREALALASTQGLSDEKQRQLSALSDRLSHAEANTDRFIPRFALASWALGVDHPRRFLVLVQDTSVRRATGGLIGSYGIMEAAGGAITKLSFDDVYNLDGQLTANVVPPEPLQKVTTSWAVRNANWFLDFPLSAQKISYLYSKAGGKDIDGVITLDEQVFDRLLDITGPIAAPHHEGVIVSSFNVGELLMAQTELDFGKTRGASLQVLQDVVSTIFTVLEQSSEESIGAALSAMDAGLGQKDVMVWLPDQTKEALIEQNRWGGSIARAPASDYLAVVSSDIGSRPNNADVPQILKETHIGGDGTITDTVVVQLKSRGAGTEMNPSRYIRVYVPEGSQLQEASGNIASDITSPINYTKEQFITDSDVEVSAATLRTDPVSHTDIFTESGKTVFGGWISEKEARIIYTYVLPFRAGLQGASPGLSFVFQKQPGVDASLHFTLTVPEGTQVVQDPASGVSTDFSGDLLTDKTFTVMFK